MGLALEVGMLANLSKTDPQCVKWWQDNMGRLNTFLPSVNLQPHNEPTRCEVYCCEMYGYSGLHYLRRIAAHLALRSKLPPPGTDDASKDPVLEEYFETLGKGKPGFLARIMGKTPQSGMFDHLILHSDAEGYYLPQAFESVLFPPQTLKIPGGMVGSSHRLREECERLAKELQLPLDLDPEEDTVWEAAHSQGKGETQWQRYGVESFTCLRLYQAAARSLESGAAIVFC